MKRTILSLALFSVAILAAPGLTGADDSSRSQDDQQIKKIEREWLDAMVKRDAAYLQKLETDDFSITGPNGQTLGKEADLKNTMSGDTVFDDIKLDHVKVRFHGDTAIANGVGTIRAHSKNEKIRGKYSWTDVFVKMNGEWKAIAAHVTAVAPEKK